MSIIFATAGCTQASISTEKTEQVSENPISFSALSPAEFKEMSQKEDVVVIDIRTPQEIAQGKVINTAKEIDFYAPDFKEKIQSLDPTKTYLLYCHSGNRTNAAKSIMKDFGFKNVYDLAGGMGAWEKSGCKTVCKNK